MFRFPPLTPTVKKILIALFGTYVAQLILQNFIQVPVFDWIALDIAHPGLPTLWQVLSFPFAAPTVPAYVISFLITLVFLWWMLAPFEMRFGSKRTLQLCLVASFSAALPALIVGLLFASSTPLFGAGPWLLATISAFAWSYRHQGKLSLFGVLDMKSVHLIWAVVGLSVLMFLASRNFVELIADLGAIGGGMAFIEWLRKPRTPKNRGSFRVISGGNQQKTWLN